MWGFKDDLNLWMVKRNSGNSEYYKDTHDFCSWTKVDLTELSVAPFHNTSHNPTTFDFERFLERRVKEKITGMKTAESLIRRDNEVIDPRPTGQ